MHRLYGLACVIAVVATAPADAQAPRLEEVLARAGAYAVNYGRSMPLLAADERADDILRGFGVQSSDTPGMEVAGHTEVRLLRGTVVFEVLPDEKGWQAFRDVYEVNTRVLPGEKERFVDLFRNRTPAAAKEIAAMDQMSQRWLTSQMPGPFNVPAFAMSFLLPKNQPRFSFRRTGEKKVDGEAVWVVTYLETARPPMTTNRVGEEYPFHGELWIEPASGRLVKSKIIVENTTPAQGSMKDTEGFRPRFTIDVVYKLDPALKAWVPVEMKRLWVKATEQVTCEAKYSRFRLITPEDAPRLPR